MAVTDRATTRTAEVTDASDDHRKPPMSTLAILLMNFGFFGIQFSFGLQQSAVNPIFTFIGAQPDQLPLLNLAGPVTGLVIQPLIGAMSDRTWTRFGRRKPFFIVGAIGCFVMLLLFPFVGALWVAFLFMWLLDASNNTAMEPYRAFISDRLPKSQLARGFLIQSMFVGLGAVSANLSLLIFQHVINGVTGNGIPYWVYVCFWIGAVCSIGSVLVSVLKTKEIPPTDEELAEMRSKAGGPKGFITEISSAVREMPVGMHKIGLVFLFQWFAMAVYWQFVAVAMTENVFPSTDPAKPVSDAASGWVGAVNGMYNLVTIFAALALIPLAQKFGAKRVGAGCLVLGAIGMITFANLHNQYALLVPEIGVGICWASMLGIPYIMVASMVPKERSGVYMGIVNMMIVVPMLIQNVSFGWIFNHLLDGKGSNAIMLVGALLGCAAIAMLWVNPPASTEESALMPLGAPRKLSVYDKVIVGSDGTNNSLIPVGHAAGVAAAANAQLVIVSAYNDSAAPPEADTAGNILVHQEIYGQDAARRALEKSVAQLTKGKIRNIEQVMVAGDAAHALLTAAGDNPHNVIVVGNRGLGASDGGLLGSVPAAVVQKAVCDVMIVQTGSDTYGTALPTQTTIRTG